MGASLGTAPYVPYGACAVSITGPGRRRNDQDASVTHAGSRNSLAAESMRVRSRGE